MKKTVIASTLAVGLGVTGAAAGNSADASEQGIDKADLAQQARSCLREACNGYQPAAYSAFPPRQVGC